MTTKNSSYLKSLEIAKNFRACLEIIMVQSDFTSAQDRALTAYEYPREKNIVTSLVQCLRMYLWCLGVSHKDDRCHYDSRHDDIINNDCCHQT